MQHEKPSNDNELTSPGAELGRWARVYSELAEIRELSKHCSNRSLATHEAVRSLSRRSLHFPLAVASLAVLIAIYAAARASSAYAAVEQCRLERSAQAAQPAAYVEGK